MADGRYVVRVEIPAIDPARDLDITVRDGQLTITAQRGEQNESTGRSKFRYGPFVRAVALPAHADENDIKVSYAQGILTLSVAAPKTPAKDTYQSSAPGKRSGSTAGSDGISEVKAAGGQILISDVTNFSRIDH